MALVFNVFIALITHWSISLHKIFIGMITLKSSPRRATALEIVAFARGRPSLGIAESHAQSSLPLRNCVIPRAGGLHRSKLWYFMEDHRSGIESHALEPSSPRKCRSHALSRPPLGIAESARGSQLPENVNYTRGNGPSLRNCGISRAG